MWASEISVVGGSPAVARGSVQAAAAPAQAAVVTFFAPCIPMPTGAATTHGAQAAQMMQAGTAPAMLMAATAPVNHPATVHALPPVQAHMMQSQAASPVQVPGPAGTINLLEVYAAVCSLYDDELKPYGRILRKRLAECCSLAADVDIRVLQSACEALPDLEVMHEDGGDWSVICKGRPKSFVDVYSPLDTYSPLMWRAAREYFDGLEDAKMVLPGGRYSCAQALATRRLPFLQGLSLGQVCHIVQLAISQKKLLGYLNGAVVPYRRSQSMVKEQCAANGRPSAGNARGMTMPFATWDGVRACIKEILAEQAQLSGRAAFVPLSNIKRLFRSKFHLELSETALGHAKLSELLQDDRLHDLCAVRLQGHGYVVLPTEGTLQVVQQQQQQKQQQHQIQPHELLRLPSSQAQPMQRRPLTTYEGALKSDTNNSIRPPPPFPLGDIACGDDTTCTGTTGSAESVATPENFGSIPMDASWRSLAQQQVWPSTSQQEAPLPRILGSEACSPVRGHNAVSPAYARNNNAKAKAVSENKVEEDDIATAAGQRVVRLAELV